ncbi:hypothetical protein D3C84_981560 [compost metagenome]
MIGAGYLQQEMPGEIDTDHRNFQASGQFQGNQAEGQGLPAFACQDFVQQRRSRP